MSAPGPLNWCDLAHSLPFTLPGGYAVDLHALQGNLSASPHYRRVVLSSENHVKVFAKGLHIYKQ